ncbi:MAG: GTPase domain-containing protein [Planctomycetota bacterium]|nr:GTPase domain-containing protein [Planctomycetota bacterium]
MVQINFAQKSVTVKIVYYGPGMSGKTTNLEIVHQRAPEPNKGDLTSISTDGDRTLFFDFMPLDLGTVAGMRTQFQIYTVPGQVYYNSTRKLVLQGVDGVIFIADSSASMLQENLESLANLQENLREYGKDIDEIPMVIQYNKRDLPDAMSVEELDQHLNQRGAPCFEAIASSGQGVFPTLKALAARVLDSIHEQTGASPGARPVAPAPSPAPAPLAQAPAQSIASEAPAPQPPLPAPVAMQAPRAPIPAPAASPNSEPADPGQVAASAAQTAHWTAAPAPAPTAGPASIPLGDAPVAPAAGAPAQALPGAGLNAATVTGVPERAPSPAPPDGQGVTGELRMAQPEPQRFSAAAVPAPMPSPPAAPATAPVIAPVPAAHAAVSSSIAPASAARPFRGGGPQAAHTPGGRLRPRTAPAPSAGGGGDVKSKIITAIIVLGATVAGVVIGGTVFDLI